MSSLLKVNRVEPTNPALPVDFGGISIPTFNGVPLSTGSGSVGTLATPAGTAQTAVVLTAGTGAPSDSDGSNGWIYFRSDGGTNTTVYHKRAGVWIGIL